MIRFLARPLALMTCVTVSLAAQNSDIPVRVNVRAMVGDSPLACGRSYPSIGKASSTIQATEFKFFVHDVHLVRRDGQTVPVTLTQDGLWQNGTVAMLDFEDGTAGCSNGNADLRDVIEGTAPVGDYTGVGFTLGVPFDRNHLDLTAQPSPLSLTRMFWAWNSGYKFLRLDLNTEGAQNWMVHLGSTECTPTGSATTIPTNCRHQNRTQVVLADFDATRDAIQLDVAELLRGADVSRNQPKTASGCMSAPNDNDCAPLFDALGLPFGSSAGGKQRVFGVMRGALAAPDAPSR